MKTKQEVKSVSALAGRFVSVPEALRQMNGLRGTGRFAGIHLHILKKICKLRPGRAYMFNPTSKIEPKEAFAIKHSVEGLLKREHFPGKVYLNPHKGIFVLVRNEDSKKQEGANE